MKFKAELKETKQAKSSSQDNTYTVKFVTDNPMVMDLGKLPSDTLFEVEVGISE